VILEFHQTIAPGTPHFFRNHHLIAMDAFKALRNHKSLAYRGHFSTGVLHHIVILFYLCDQFFDFFLGKRGLFPEKQVPG